MVQVLGKYMIIRYLDPEGLKHDVTRATKNPEQSNAWEVQWLKEETQPGHSPNPTLRIQVPNHHILTQNLYDNYYYPKPKYLIMGYRDPLGKIQTEPCTNPKFQTGPASSGTPCPAPPWIPLRSLSKMSPMQSPTCSM